MTRRGTTLLELIVAVALLAAMTAAAMQMLRVTAAQRRATSARQAAVLEAANLMERLAARSWDELTEEGVQDVELSPEARRRLPAGELEIDITSPTDQPDARRIALRLRWQGDSGQLLRPVRLLAWRYRGVGEMKTDQ